MLWRAQQPAARNWLYAHTQNFYDEMSLNKIGTGLCGGQQPADSRFAAAPIPPQSPLDGIFAQGVTTGTYTEVGMAEQTRSSFGLFAHHHAGRCCRRCRSIDMQLRPGSEALLVCCGGLQYSPGHATLCRSFLQPDCTPEPPPKAPHTPALLTCCGGCCGVAQGQVFQIRIHMSTAHWGRFELRLCPLSDPSLTTENMEFNEACLAAHQLYLAPNATQPGADSKVPFLPPNTVYAKAGLKAHQLYLAPHAMQPGADSTHTPQPRANMP